LIVSISHHYGPPMITLMAPELLQAYPNPLQLFDALWVTENDVVLVCAYAIGAITAIVAAIATTARIVAKIGSILFIIPLSYKLLIKDIVIREITGNFTLYGQGKQHKRMYRKIIHVSGGGKR
jgi:hypothetical protein